MSCLFFLEGGNTYGGVGSGGGERSSIEGARCQIGQNSGPDGGVCKVALNNQ